MLEVRSTGLKNGRVCYRVSPHRIAHTYWRCELAIDQIQILRLS
jgi:hypothetical protein